MGRYIQDAGINQPLDVVSMTMEDYVYHNRYTRTDWNGEPVYHCTDAAGKDRYLKWSYASGILHLEAWMKGAFGEEADLNGIGKDKRAYKNSIDGLIAKLRNHSGDMQNAGYIGHDPLQNCSTEGYGQQATSRQQTSYGHPQQQAAPRQQTSYGHPQQQATSRQQTSYGQPRQQTAPRQQTSYSQPQQQTAQSGSQPVYTSSWMGGGKRSISSGSGYTSAGNTGNSNLWGVLALVLAFVFPIMGLILGIIGKSRYTAALSEDANNSTAKNGEKLCKIAIGIGIFMFVISFLSPFLSFVIMMLQY